MNSKLIITSAIAGLVALGTISGSANAQDKRAEKERKMFRCRKKGGKRLRYGQPFMCRPGEG